MIRKKIKFCECGCGKIVKHRFITGHNNRGIKFSEEHKKKLRENHVGFTGQKWTEEMKKKTRKPKHSGFGELVSKALKGRVFSEEWKQKIREANLGKKYSQETKNKHSIASKKMWKNPEFAKKIHLSRHVKPNRPETIVLNMLNNLYPKEWKYTGDYSFMINGKNPDFVNCNGQKKCIELFGDYWHRGQNPKHRIKEFKSFGFDTLIIWEKELKNITKVSNKIVKFHEAKKIGGVDD